MNIAQSLDFDMVFKSEWRKLNNFKISADVSKKTAGKGNFFIFTAKKYPFSTTPCI